MSETKNILKQILQEELDSHNLEIEEKANRYDELKRLIRESLEAEVAAETKEAAKD